MGLMSYSSLKIDKEGIKKTKKSSAVVAGPTGARGGKDGPSGSLQAASHLVMDQNMDQNFEGSHATFGLHFTPGHTAFSEQRRCNLLLA
jgi:hypothetical protein